MAELEAFVSQVEKTELTLASAIASQQPNTFLFFSLFFIPLFYFILFFAHCSILSMHSTTCVPH